METKVKKYSYGLDGLMEVIGCSKATAWRIKKSGVINDAIVQFGRKIIVDDEKVLECLKNHSDLAKV